MNLVYALKDDVLTHVSDVERGLACGCRCPYCDEALIARKGKKKEHHFAHQSGSECEHAYESSLHLMAKEILSEAESIFLPWAGVDFLSLNRPRITIQEEGEFPIEHVELEKRFGSVIPDVIIYIDGRLLFVEIYVTHPIDDEKLEKLKELGIPTIEIDLSDMKGPATKEELSEILLGKSIQKYWKYHPNADKAREEIYQDAHRLPVNDTWTNLMGWTEGTRCPCSGRIVPIWMTCRHCEHYVWNYDSYILCSYEKLTEVQKQKESSSSDSEYEKKMKNLYEQMDKEKQQIQSEQPKPQKSVEPRIADVAKEILLDTMGLSAPGEELSIGRTEQDGDDIILYVYFQKAVRVVFVPDKKDCIERLLYIDLNALSKFVTRKRFAEELINNTSIKQWLNEKAL